MFNAYGLSLVLHPYNPFVPTIHMNIRLFELLNEKIVVNPLISIKKSETENYFEENDLPKHPLLDEGYFSIGCIHCTFKTTEDNNIRSGRWKNKIKTECGIHLSRKN